MRVLVFSVVAALVLAPSAGAQTPLRTKLVVGGLDQPVFVTHAPGDGQRLFALEKATGHVEASRPCRLIIRSAGATRKRHRAFPVAASNA